ncbi:YggS family pyridoxal phosphate-dependent enzyme [Caldichromatium japonicum]|uniref:Pyridoxal phosphate homeostasis protein n=1 Tax=Caldichromatium japonicum TaxID=2699430 RepID=A0A6G7VAA8_9GAMM|nr:YggS family pyridoxal phosphate-dependent enzyme [Caldichromatium japonicum]QIK36892.1 YggS family pyridoxal phosphate-dependent enzyme [Caldichromatium japonicum]
MNPQDIAANYERLMARIRSAAERAGRSPETIQLIAVGKQQPAAAIRALYALGQRAFGESYVQEALGKQAELADLKDIEWHFIGRIQANKTRALAAHFAWVHGLADRHHAERLSAQHPPERLPLRVCLQVNLSGEASKSGVAPEALPELLAACKSLPNFEVCGLMTLPAPAMGEEAQRRPFRRLRELRDRLATPSHPLPVLSMGMSDDLEAAILEGATQVRVGTALFGNRT